MQLKRLNFTLFFIIRIILINFLAIYVAFADQSEKLLEQLSNVNAPSGFEEPVRNILEAYWRQNGVNYEVDGLGNLLGRYPSHSPKKPTILIMAHMDEVGFLTSKIDDNGFIYINSLGVWLDYILWDEEWVINTKDRSIPAFSGMDPPHVIARNKRDNLLPIDQSFMFLDTGLTKQDLIKLGIRPGLPVTPYFKFTILKSRKRYAGKAFDDRAGLAAMIGLMQAIRANPNMLNKVNVVFAATVQEEVGLHGANAVYASLKPDLILNIEAGIARDYPKQFAREQEPKLGYGPTLFIYDASMVPNPNLVTLISNIAKVNDIPFQWESESAYSQDASRLQEMNRGIPAINIGIPVRYAHSHAGIMDRDDYDNTVRLLTHIALWLDEKNIAQLS